MLLIDLLATKLNRWPTGVTYISQGRETGNLYDHNGDLLKPKTIYPVSDNAGKHAIVYRLEWLARRRELATAAEDKAITQRLETANHLAKCRAEEGEPAQAPAKHPHHHDLTISGRGHNMDMGTPEKKPEPLDFSGPVLDFSQKPTGTMTLVELLAKHWECWPVDFPANVLQAGDGGIYPTGNFSGAPISILPIASDWGIASVSREQWSWRRTNHPARPESEWRKGWDKRGYPLKGTTCEYNVSLAGSPAVYITVHVKYSSPFTVVFECTYKPEGVEFATIGQEYSALASGFDNPFRPIRSPSEIAAEELADKVDAMLALDSSSGMLSRREFCIELIKAGYAPAKESDISRTATLAKLSDAYFQGTRDHRGGLEAIYDHGFRLLSPPDHKAAQ